MTLTAAKKKLSEAQSIFLRRVNRCPKGTYVERRERKTAAVLHALGLIDINASGIIAFRKEAGK